MLQITLYCLMFILVRYSSSRHYLIETHEEEFSEMEPVNDSLGESGMPSIKKTFFVANVKPPLPPPPFV